MITMGLGLGNSLFSGLTFTVYESRSDEIEILLSDLNSLTSQTILMSMTNEDEQSVFIGTMSENFGTALTMSLIFQAGNVDDQSVDLGKFLGIKSVEVELLV